jgi:hypothetical protein
MRTGRRRTLGRSSAAIASSIPGPSQTRREFVSTSRCSAVWSSPEETMQTGGRAKKQAAAPLFGSDCLYLRRAQSAIGEMYSSCKPLQQRRLQRGQHLLRVHRCLHRFQIASTSGTPLTAPDECIRVATLLDRANRSCRGLFSPQQMETKQSLCVANCVRLLRRSPLAEPSNAMRVPKRRSLPREPGLLI